MRLCFGGDCIQSAASFQRSLAKCLAAARRSMSRSYPCRSLIPVPSNCVMVWSTQNACVATSLSFKKHQLLVFVPGVLFVVVCWWCLVLLDTRVSSQSSVHRLLSLTMRQVPRQCCDVSASFGRYRFHDICVGLLPRTTRPAGPGPWVIAHFEGIRTKQARSRAT